MPKIDTTKQKDVKPYGIQPNTNQMTFQERLMERFKAHEYVKVINVDSEPFMWQYMPAEKEEYEYTPDGMHRHTRREDPEVWMLDPGESETIVGANAYIMIEALYKKVIAKKVEMTLEVKPGQARAFNFADGTAQDYWIGRILVGKEVPTFIALKTETTNAPIKRGPGRPATATV